MRDKSVSHERGAQMGDCAAAHGACALCITKRAIWRKNGLNLNKSQALRPRPILMLGFDCVVR